MLCSKQWTKLLRGLIMKKSKSIEELDRLSKLPDALIFSILELLPMRDVVATTFLSKRWRNLWITTRCLDFANCRGDDAAFITRALLFWRGSKILKLKIELRNSIQEFSFSDVDSWVRFAKEHEVQELYLRPAEPETEYHVPQYLFSSCPSLKVLSLEGCVLRLNRDVQWNQLKSLNIHMYGLDDPLGHDDFNHVLAGCPQLEVLVLRVYQSEQDLTIRSASLKKLSIAKKRRGGVTGNSLLDARLTIWTPNLETFEILKVPYTCSLENVSSLTDTSLLFDDTRFFFSDDDVRDQVLKQYLPAIQHVGNVTISEWTIQALVELKKKHPVPRLLDVKFLKLSYEYLDHEELASVLEIFPRVKTLVLEDATTAEFSYDEKRFFNFQPSLPDLTRVEVTWCKNHSMFALIEILLKYSSKLEKMVFRVKESRIDPLESPYKYKSLFLASQKLLRMQRASPAAKFIFCDYP